MFKSTLTKNFLIRISVYSVVFIAVLLTLFRLGLLLLLERPAVLEQTLSKKLGATIHIQSIATDWQGSDLALILHHVSIENPANQSSAHLQQAGLVLNVLKTVRHLKWHFRSLWIEQFEGALKTNNHQKISLKTWLSDLEWLLEQPQWLMRDIKLHLQDPNHPHIVISIPQIARTTHNEQQLISGSVQINPINAPYPSTLQFSAAFKGPLEQPRQWKGSFFARGDHLALPVLSQFIDTSLVIQDGELDFKLWGNLHQEKTNVKSELSLNQFRLLTDTREDVVVPHGQLRVDFHQENKNQWVLLGHQINLQTDPLSGLESYFQLQKTMVGDKPQFSFLADYLELKTLDNFLQLIPSNLLPLILVDFLKYSKPSGIMKQIHLTLGESQVPEIFKAQFQNIKLSSFKTWPGFDGLSGEVIHEKNKGTLLIQNRDIKFNWPNIFQSPLLFSQINGQATWQKVENQWFVQVPLLAIKNPDLEVNSRFQIVIPPEESLQLSLTASFINIDGQAHPPYLPVHIMDPKLVEWLNRSIAQAQFPQGGLILRGNLKEFPFTEHTGVFEVGSKVQNLVLNYDPAWPVLEKGAGELDFTGAGMRITLDKGLIAGIEASHILALIPSFLVDNPILHIKSQLHGSSLAGVRFLQHYILPDKLEDLDLKGPLFVVLNLDIPFEDNESVQVKGQAKLKDNQIHFAPLKVLLTRVNGQVNFTEDTIQSEKLSASLFDEPLSITLNTAPNEKHTFLAEAQGILAGHRLSKTLEGKTNFQAALQFKESTAAFQIQSDLNGLAIKLPPPLSKSVGEKGALQINGQIAEDRKTQVSVDLKTRLNTPPINLLVTNPLKRWNIAVKVPNFLLGTVYIPATETTKNTLNRAPIEFNLDMLKLSPEQTNAPQVSSNLKPTDIPKLQGNIQNFVYEDKAIGSVQLSTQPTEHGTLFQAIVKNGKVSSTEFDGFWTEHNGQSMNRLKGVLHSNNISKDLTLLGIDAGIEDSTADVGFNFRWSGKPTDFDLATIKGQMSVKLQDGRLVDVSTGPSRIFGLLSIQALKRRLTLDFSDLFKKGLAFDKLEGTFNIKEGNAFTCDTVLVGPSTHITLQGRTGFMARDYHQVAYIALDLTGSLPFIVGAFNPIAGAATWLGNKLLEDQVNRLTRLQYTMTGPWDNPSITVTKAPSVFKPWEIIPELLPTDKKPKDKLVASWCDLEMD